MKKLLILAAMAGVALVSCVKNEPAPSVTDQQEITFAPPVMGTMTKANSFGELSGVYPVAENFNVYAVWHSGEEFLGWETSASLYMDDVFTRYDNGYNGWRPDTRYYWPEHGGVLTFAAYSPSSVDVSGKSYTKEGLQLTGFKTGVKGTAGLTGYVDVLYSERSYEKRANSSNSNDPYDGVDITFKHALSSIHFTAKKAADYGSTAENTTDIYLKKITVYGVYSQADFNEGVDETDADVYKSSPAWSNHSSYNTIIGESNPYIYFEGDQKLSSGLFVMKSDANHTDVIVVPQTLPETAKVKLEYTIDSPGTSTPQIAQTHIVDLESVTATWEPGMRYTYNISIALDEITFSPTVEVWTDTHKDAGNNDVSNDYPVEVN